MQSRGEHQSSRSLHPAAVTAAVGLPFRRVCLAVGLAIFGIVPVAVPASATTSMGCTADSSRDLRIHVVNEAGASGAMLDAAAIQAAAIWAAAGLRLTWTFAPSPFDVTDGRSIRVIIRRGFSQSYVPGTAEMKQRSDASLAWLHFDANERPGNVIQVFLGTVAAIVATGTMLDRPVATLPDTLYGPLLGRALGRVVAHELGHWTVGREHSDTGVMREKFGARELLDPGIPQLPRAWTTSAMDGLLTSSPRCLPLPSASNEKTRQAS